MPKSLEHGQPAICGSLQTRVRRQAVDDLRAISSPGDISAFHASSFGNLVVNVQSPSREVCEPSPTVEYFPTCFYARRNKTWAESRITGRMQVWNKHASYGKRRRRPMVRPVTWAAAAWAKNANSSSGISMPMSRGPAKVGLIRSNS